MKLVITGPRSVGKSTISKILATQLKVNYISSDELSENFLRKKYKKSLDQAIKSGAIKEFIEKDAYKLIKSALNKKDFVFDLASGAISSKTHEKTCKKIISLVKDYKIIALLPYKNQTKSINLLFKRELKREHFKDANKVELKNKVSKDYKKLLPILKQLNVKIVYTLDGNPDKIIKKIIKS